MNLKILVVGRNAQILETILRLINGQKGWQATGAMTDEEAMDVFSAQPADVVLIGGGVDERSEQNLSSAFKNINPAVKMVRHYGGGSGLLFTEILAATSPRPSPEERENTN